MKMKRKIKKVFLGIIGAFTLFLLKIKAFANMVSSLPQGNQGQAAYGVYNTIGPIELTLRFLQRIAFPVILVLGVFVVGKNYYKLRKKKKEIEMEMKSARGQKLYGVPSSITRYNNKDIKNRKEIEELKKKFKRALIVLIVVLILWGLTWYLLYSKKVVAI